MCRIVARANEYARAHGLRPFVAYQGKWSASMRDFERDIIPMCRAEGMALCPWGVLGSGHFKTKEQREANDGRKFLPASDADIKLSDVLERIAVRKGSIITGIALAYVMHKTPYVFPICGGRKVEHLQGNIDALRVRLSQEDMDEIEAAVPFDLGFPHNFALTVAGPASIGHEIGPGDLWVSKLAGHCDFVQREAPIPGGLHNAELDEAQKESSS
jgi:aryl-alcohol dehydrogenase-like predicted oxidoreductase